MNSMCRQYEKGKGHYRATYLAERSILDIKGCAWMTRKELVEIAVFAGT
jgi:hypothetical protein